MVVDPAEGTRLMAEAEAYRQDLRAAVERSIALSPVVPVRDGTFHSVIPFACYVRGLATGAWGWQRDGSGAHVGPLYWETVQSAAALISPAGLLSPDDVRVQGYLDVLEDRLLLENSNVGDRDWFSAGWQYQGGLERTANMHLAADDIPTFLRSFLNCYAVDILPDEWICLQRARSPRSAGQDLRGGRVSGAVPQSAGDGTGRYACGLPAPRRAHGSARARRIVGEECAHAIRDRWPTRSSRMRTTAPSPRRWRCPRAIRPSHVRLRLRHPAAARIQGVTVNGRRGPNSTRKRRRLISNGLTGTVHVVVNLSVTSITGVVSSRFSMGVRNQPSSQTMIGFGTARDLLPGHFPDRPRGGVPKRGLQTVAP